MNLSITKTLKNIDIVKAFQEVAKLNINGLEDAGCNMYNLSIPLFYGMCDAIVQVYPFGDYDLVWVLIYDENGEHEDWSIYDFPKSVQKNILKTYIKSLSVENMVKID